MIIGDNDLSAQPMLIYVYNQLSPNRHLTHVQYTQTGTIRQTNAPLVPIVRLRQFMYNYVSVKVETRST